MRAQLRGNIVWNVSASRFQSPAEKHLSLESCLAPKIFSQHLKLFACKLYKNIHLGSKLVRLELGIMLSTEKPSLSDNDPGEWD
jgi:hypothetical protein